MFKRVFEFWKDFFKRKSHYQLHSPFVYDWYMETIANDKIFYDFEKIEKIRSDFFQNPAKVQVHQKMISLAKMAQILDFPNSEGEFLLKFSNFWNPKTLIETGTLLGMSSIYQITPLVSPDAYLFGTENLKNEVFKTLKYSDNKATFYHDLSKLPILLPKLPTLDWVLVRNTDAKECQMIWENCLNFFTEKSVFILYHFQENSEKKKLWEKICQNENVRLSIDLKYFGVAFFRTEQPKQHFILKF